MMVGGAGAGKLDTLHCLLVAGADQDIGLTASGNTPLHAATKGDQVEVARLLLDYNADTGLCSKYGLTPSTLLILLADTASSITSRDEITHILNFNNYF